MGAEVLHVVGVDHGQTGSVGHVKDGRQGVLDVVAGPVGPLAVVEHAAQGEGAGPHDVGPCHVVRGVLQGGPGGGDHRPHQGLCQGVGDALGVGLGEVELPDVAEGVHDAVDHLVLGQGVGQGGVQDGKNRVGQVGVIAVLLPGGPVGDHRGPVHLTAGGGDGQDGAQGDGVLGLLPVHEEGLPEVPVGPGTHGDGLGAVDDAAAAYGQDEVDAVGLAQVDALVDLFGPGVGHDPSQLHHVLAGLCQGSQDTVIEAAGLDAAPAVDQQDLLPYPCQLLRQLGHGLLAEVDSDGVIKSEIIHTNIS